MKEKQKFNPFPQNLSSQKHQHLEFLAIWSQRVALGLNANKK
jgi:hypothetical protein